ncbi:hypothetical protein COOONC_10020 [Cooperia oncophora]
MSRELRKSRAVKIAIALILLSLYITLLHLHLPGRREILESPAEVVLNISVNVSIFDNCPLIVFDHLDPQLLRFHNPDYNPKTGCTPYEPLTVLEEGLLRTTEKAEGYECSASCDILSRNLSIPRIPSRLSYRILSQQYRCLYNDHDSKYNADPWINLPSNETFRCDIIESQCSNGNLFSNNESYLHTQIYETGSQKLQDDERPHVYILLLDSVSSFMAKRSLPKTLQYLKTELDAVQMEFLNKVAHNSRPNAFPLFLGKTIEGGSRALVGLPPIKVDLDDYGNCNKYLDKYSYELEEYRLSGYKTMVAQDWDVGFLYYPNCSGLNRSEADHMWRPFDKRMEESSTLKKIRDDHCSEPHVEMLDYFEKFMHSYPGVPKICHVWCVYLAHDTMKDIYHTDEQFLELLQEEH